MVIDGNKVDNISHDDMASKRLKLRIKLWHKINFNSLHSQYSWYERRERHETHLRSHWQTRKEPRLSHQAVWPQRRWRQCPTTNRQTRDLQHQSILSWCSQQGCQCENSSSMCWRWQRLPWGSTTIVKLRPIQCNRGNCENDDKELHMLTWTFSTLNSSIRTY